MTITTAMVLAAGLGKRMRPITDTMPKPLVKIAGKALLDWGLDSLVEAGVRKGGGQRPLPARPDHRPRLQRANRPRIVISDERDTLLDSAGGIVKALPELGDEAFFILNADTFWIDAGRSNLTRLALEWDPERMDILLMLSDLTSATGHSGSTDFLRAPDGRLSRAAGDPAGLIYAGAAIIASAAVRRTRRPESHSLNRYFDAAIAKGRLYGMPLDGQLDHGRHAGRHRAGRSGGQPRPRQGSMNSRAAPRVLTIPPGVAVPAGACRGAERRPARPRISGRTAIRSRWPTSRSTCPPGVRRANCGRIFVERSGGTSAILPLIRPLGEFDEDGAAFFASGAEALDLLQPISAIDRLLLLGPLVQRWKRNLPAHVAAKVRGGIRRAGLGGGFDLAGPRSRRTDRRGRDRRVGLGQACRAGRRRSRRLVAGDARFPRDHHRALAADPCRPPTLQSGGAPQRVDPRRGGTASVASAIRADHRCRFDRLDSSHGGTAFVDRTPATRRGRAAGPRYGDGRGFMVGAGSSRAGAVGARSSAIRPGEAVAAHRRCSRRRRAAGECVQLP